MVGYIYYIYIYHTYIGGPQYYNLGGWALSLWDFVTIKLEVCD